MKPAFARRRRYRPAQPPEEFARALQELVRSGRLTGAVSGGRFRLSLPGWGRLLVVADGTITPHAAGTWVEMRVGVNGWIATALGVVLGYSILRFSFLMFAFYLASTGVAQVLDPTRHLVTASLLLAASVVVALVVIGIWLPQRSRLVAVLEGAAG